MVKRLGWLYPNWFHLWMRQRERQVALHADGSPGSAAAAEAASGGFAEPMLRKKAALVNYKQMEFR